MMVEDPKTPNDAIVPNVSENEMSRTDRVVSLRRSGLSFQGIGDEIGVSKSTAFRIWKDANLPEKTVTKRQTSFESLDNMPPLPNEPVEFMDDYELKDTAKRLKTELAVKRMRARSRWLDYVAAHPEAYQYHAERDGHNSRDDFKDKLLLELLRGKTETKDPFALALEISKLLSAAGSDKSPGQIISEVMAVTEAIKGLNPAPSANWNPESLIQYEKLKADIETQKQKNIADSKFKNEALKVVLKGLDAISKDPRAQKIAGNLLGKVENKLGVPANPEDANKFLCPECLKKGKRSVIDVTGAPPSVQCPTCHRTFSRNTGDNEVLMNSENDMLKGEN
jgi:hypothetical protein